MTELPQDPVEDLPTEKASEPALSSGGIVAGATLVLNGLILYGVVITTEQKLFWLTAISFLAPVLAASWIRFKVWSPASVAKVVAHYRAQVEEQHDRVRQAQAEVAATKSTIIAVQEVIPTAIQSALNASQPAARPLPRDDYPRPASDRVYGDQDGRWDERGDQSRPVRYPDPEPEPPRGYRRHGLHEEPAG